MRRKSWLSVSVAVALTGCIFFLTPAYVAAAPTVIKLAHVDPADVWQSKKGAMTRAFKDIVEAETGGAIKVDLFPASQLGSEREILEGTQLGTIQMCAVSGVIGGQFKPAMVLDIPYLFSSPAVAWKVLDGPFGKELTAGILEKTGMYNLAYGETGFRNFTNFVRPIKGPADLKGLKIRVMETPVYMSLVKSLGGSPTPIAWAETYSALQQKVVDGLELPVSVVIQVKMYEVLKYMCLDAHTYSADFLLINNKFYQGLSKEHRKIIKDAAVVASTCGRAIQQLNSAMGIATLKEKGMIIYSPNDKERAEFKRLAQGPIVEWMKTQVEQKWIDKVMAAVKQAEAELAVK